MIPTVLALLLLGHVLGDFYLQTTAMAEKKAENFHDLLFHGIIYMSCMAAVLLAGVALSRAMVCLWLAASVQHICVDYFKRYIKIKPFVTDQLLHLFLLWAVWLLWGTGLRLTPIAMLKADAFPERPVVVIVLGLLCVLRPIGILIGKGEIWDFSQSKKKPTKAQAGAGKMIGYLERVIVFFLLLYGQYPSIGFVVAAKSVARFPEITKKKKQSLAEYYLIGTLLSMVSVFAVTLLLGLAG